MARTVRNAKIDTRSARAKLNARPEPYWTVISTGCAIGYRRGEKGGTWVGRFRDAEAQRHYRALGSADDARDADGTTVLSYTQAQELARTWFAEMARPPEQAQPDRPYTVADCMRDYLAWYETHRKPSGYAFACTTSKAHIEPSLGAIEVARLTTARMRDWHARLATAPARLRSKHGADQRHRPAPAHADGERARKATANRVLTVLKAALNHAFREGRVASDLSWRRVSPFRGADAARLRYLSHEECKRLLNACRPDFRRLVTGALVSGCRYGELTRLQVSDFSADAGSLLIREAKSGRPRYVPLDPEARAFFATLVAGREATDLIFLRDKGRAWGRAHQVRPLAEASTAARLDARANFHCLRHTWASHRVMAGAPLMVVAQVLGHGDTRMVEKHYGHLAPSYIREAIERTSLGIVQAEEKVKPMRSML
jgi:integrase